MAESFIPSNLSKPSPMNEPTQLKIPERLSKPPQSPVTTSTVVSPIKTQEGPSQASTEAPRLSQKEVIADEDRMAAIREYMVDRKGVKYLDKPPEEVMDDYITHMRYVEAGEVRLVGEIYYTHKLPPEKKEIASRAFQVYQEIEPFWKQGIGESAEAILDYSLAAIRPDTSPSTLLSLGVGAAATKTAGKKLGIEALKAAYRTGTKSGLQKIAAKKAIQSAERKAGLIGLGKSAIVDGAIAGAFDTSYQEGLQKELDPAYEYSLGQTLFTTALAGGMTATVGAAPFLKKGAGVGTSADEIMYHRSLTKITKSKAVGQKIVSRVKKLSEALDSAEWQKAVREGKLVDLKASDQKIIADAFFDVDDPDSIASVLIDAGALLNAEDGKFTSTLIKYIEDLDPAVYKNIEGAWNAGMPGVPFKQGMDQLAGVMGQAGETFALSSKAKRSMADDVTKAVQSSTGGKQAVDKLSPKTLNYIQSTWKRLIVSNPATTAVNVKGWGIASTVRTIDDTVGIVTRPLVGTIMSIAKASPDPAIRGFAQSKALAGNIAFKMRTFMDPMGSLETFEAAWSRVPKSIANSVNRETFGGVASKTPAELHNMPDNAIVNGVESVADFASRITGIDLQDRLTRQLSGMVELDRQSRLNFNKSFAQLIRDGEEHLITDEIYERVARTSLEDTFSFNYAHGHDALNRLANAVQNVSNAPVVGFALPFGKFMNNLVAWTFSHSPAGMFEVSKRLMKGGIDDATEAFDKALVGTVSIAMLGKWSYEKMQEGDQWYEMEGVDNQNLAPLSAYVLAGRIYEMWSNGDSVPPDLIAELGKQLTLAEYGDMTSAPGVVLEAMAQASAPGAEGEAFWDPLMQEMAKMVGGVGAGFTRVVDPANDLLGMVGEPFGGGAKLDRRMAEDGGERFFLELTRYMDSILTPMFGTSEKEGDPKYLGTTARSASRPEGNIIDPNPVSTMVGTKSVLSKNFTDIMLGKVNLPPFRIDSRTRIPEFDRVLNEELAIPLNEAAKRLLANPNFKNATQAGKRMMVDKLVSEERKAARQRIEEGYLGVEPAMAAAREKFTKLPTALRAEGKTVYGWQNIPDRKLSREQIETLSLWIKEYDKEIKLIPEALAN